MRFVDLIIKPKRRFHALPANGKRVGSTICRKKKNIPINVLNYEKFHNLTEQECIHIKKILQSKTLKENIKYAENCAEINRNPTVQPKPRINKLNIQMISENLYNQVFKGNLDNNWCKRSLIEKSVEILKEHNLWTDNPDINPDVSLEIPPLKGNNIEEHFWAIGEEQSKPYRDLVKKFVENDIPQMPEVWLYKKGWTKYVYGREPEQVPYPDEDITVFDVEVCVKLGDLPTLATAVSENAWYGWVSPDLSSSINAPQPQSYSTDKLIPFENTAKFRSRPRIIVGHNVSYDRARIKEQYDFSNSALRFLDTMSLHICIGGITKSQKTILKNKVDNFEDGTETWKSYFCLSSLKDVYNLYCKKELLKEKRNVFLEGNIQDVKNDFNNLMTYCATDAKATYEILQVIFPVFLKRFPHPVTLAGMLEMSIPFLPINENWKKFLTEAEQTYDDLKKEMSLELSKKCDEACTLFHDEKYKTDLWMWNEDWSTQSFKLNKSKNIDCERGKCETVVCDEENEEETELNSKFQYLFKLENILPKKKLLLPGYPSWYRKLFEKNDLIVQPTTCMTITPKLLRLTWENFPVYYIRNLGWGILVADIYARHVNTSLPFAKLKELTLKNCKVPPDYLLKEIQTKPSIHESIDQSIRTIRKLSPPSYYKGAGIWCDHIIDNCCYFFKLPHKDGGSKNVGNPLSKDFTHIFSGNALASSDSTAKKVIDIGMKISYWRNNRERIMSQMVVWLNKKETPSQALEDDVYVGVILPKVVVCGTLTRRALESTWLTASRSTENRIGSELRSIIHAPPGYHIVGADVDSQELWIASLIGDSYDAKIHGCTPLGWMTLSGTKANGTDMHSKTAKAIGISRDHAKTVNYARIYGAGVKFAQKLLQTFNPSMNDRDAYSKAHKMYELTKGIKMYKVKQNMSEEFKNKFGTASVCDLSSAYKISKILGKNVDEVFEKFLWVKGTESAMFNQLENIASSHKPVTPFLSCRLSRALEPLFEGDTYHNNTRINWVVQSGAVDFLHLMLVCMRWLTNGHARYCFSFHDEVRYLIPTEKRYSGALALHITNLLVRAFCASRLGMYDLPQSVAFFSSVEVDKVLRKEASDDCITPSNPHGLERGYGVLPGESLNIYETLEKSKGSLAAFSEKNQKCPKPQKGSMFTEKHYKEI